MLTITRDNPTFRPVTIRIESQYDLDNLCAIIDTVACNRINQIGQQLIRAAVDFRNQLHTTINED